MKSHISSSGSDILRTILSPFFFTSQGSHKNISTEDFSVENTNYRSTLIHDTISLSKRLLQTQKCLEHPSEVDHIVEWLFRLLNL
jgi:negative regulator of replication initiation